METNSGKDSELSTSDKLRVTLARFAGINADTYGVEDTPSLAAMEEYLAQSRSDVNSEQHASE